MAATRLICGVDEAGRGPLAGPVFAAAVILDRVDRIEGLRDSKRLSAAQRERLYVQIVQRATAVGVGRAEPEEIDSLNILRASLLAMQRAVNALGLRPQVVYVDGNQTPTLEVPVVAIVGGDDTVAAISAASIVAKVLRDREMVASAALYPEYGFEIHKGYATEMHLAALRRLGPTPLHRRSFAPVASAAPAMACLFDDLLPASECEAVVLPGVGAA